VRIAVLPRLSMVIIADLLDHFSRDTGGYDNWEQQLMLLRKMYELTENYTRILINTRLKGKALEWFRSNPTCGFF